MIFPSDITLVMLNASSEGNMAGFLGIQYTTLGPDYLEAKMPVDHRTRQP